MKDTTFKFGIACDSSDTLAGLQAKLTTLQGVVAVENEPGGDLISVRVVVEDGEHAKKVHRKIMSTIIGTEGTTITSVTSRLTDMF
jgi:hypothetical protein